MGWFICNASACSAFAAVAMFVGHWALEAAHAGTGGAFFSFDPPLRLASQPRLDAKHYARNTSEVPTAPAERKGEGAKRRAPSGAGAPGKGEGAKRADAKWSKAKGAKAKGARTKRAKTKRAEAKRISTKRVSAKRAGEEAGAMRARREAFLRLLMLAESGGRLAAKNPRSSALGPYQFISSTFLEVARKHFAGEVASLSEAEILALRTDLKFAHRAAAALTADNAEFLKARGHKATMPNLRLAFLVGATGAVRVLSADLKTPVAKLLSPGAIKANPFMASMSVRDLILRCALDVGLDVKTVEGAVKSSAELVFVPSRGKKARRPLRPRINIRCNIRLASCRRWVALQRRKLARKKMVARRAVGGKRVKPRKLAKGERSAIGHKGVGRRKGAGRRKR